MEESRSELAGEIPVLLLVPMVILRAWAFSIMYGWFLLPLGLPGMPVGRALGLLILIRMVLPGNRQKDERSVEMQLGMATLTPFVVLGLGWIVKHFV